MPALSLARARGRNEHHRHFPRSAGRTFESVAEDCAIEEGSHWNEQTSYERARKRWPASARLQEALNLVARARTGEEDADAFRLLQHHAMDMHLRFGLRAPLG